MAQIDVKELADQLVRTGYEGLFRLPDSLGRRESLWSKPGAPDSLLRLALDAGQPWLARFLAAEIIFNKQIFLFRQEHFASLVAVYVEAFKSNASGFMADWGFLADMSDTGKLGSRFILFAQLSVPLLRPLLDDPHEIPYLYPPDFPSQLRLGLRLKDFAALYLSRIYKVPIQLTEDAAQRDEEIHRLEMLI